MLRIGIVGCGRISPAYLHTLTQNFSDLLQVTACADLVRDAAVARAAEFGIPQVLEVPELLSSPDLDLVANLTIPEAHYEVTKAALEAGKHVYSEKPIADSLAQARELQSLAESNRLMLSCAPDTLLGSAWQTCRAAIDQGKIGRPALLSAYMAMRVRTPHYFRAGVGPVLDMGPYYIGAITTLLGPIKRVSATGLRPEITPPDGGEAFTPHSPARVSTSLELHSGALASLSFCSDAVFYRPSLDIIGTDGMLLCADPNGFGGKVTLLDGKSASTLPDLYPFSDNFRGLGIAEMCAAARDRRPHRLQPELSVHALEVMEAIQHAIESGVTQEMKTTCARPIPMGTTASGDPFRVTSA